MKQKDFNKTINEVLNEGKIENQDIKNIDILRYLLEDKKINKSLYDGFTKNYEMEYGSNRDYILMKIQDMLYRLHLLVNYNFIERYGVVDNDAIKNSVSVLVDNEEIVAAARINQEQGEEYRCAAWKYDAEDEEVMVLHTLVVLPESGGKGYGRAFVDFYENY